MFQIVSGVLADTIAKKGIIDPRMVKVHAYGLELLFSTVVGIFILLVISLLCGEPSLWIPFLIGFIPQRLSGGGFHAQTHSRCISIFSIGYLIILQLSKVITFPIWIMIVFATFILLVCFSPAEAVNKPLREDQRRKNRTRSLLLGLCNMLLCLWIFVVWGKMNRYLTMYFAGGSMAGLSILAAVIKKTFWRSNNEKRTEQKCSKDDEHACKRSNDSCDV